MIKGIFVKCIKVNSLLFFWCDWATLLSMKNNSLIVKNSIFLAIRTIVITIVGLYSVRELLSILGVEEYGLFNLVFGVAILFSFINGAMVSSIQRYLAYYIGKKDEDMLSAIWVNSLILHSTIAILIATLLFLLKDQIIRQFLVIDLKHLKSAYFIYYCSILVVFISIIQAPFNSLILAQEKMSFFAFLSLLDAIVKLIIIYWLYFFESYILEKYSLMYLASVITIFLIYYFYCVKNFNKGFNLKEIKLSLLKEITVYSLWNIFGNFSSMARTQGVNILLNIFIGVIANSAYAITTNVSSAIGSLINSIVTAINPQIYKSYAEEDYERNIFLINTASKFSFFLALIVVLPILFNTKYLLELWLNQLPLFLVEFVQLALIILLIDCLSGSLMTGIQATGKVKAYQIVVSISVFLNLPISYVLLKAGYEPAVVYWVAIVMAFVSLALRLYFINSLTQFSIFLYLKSVILRSFLVVISSVLLIFFLLGSINLNNSFFSFIWVSFFVFISVIFSIILFGLKSSERLFVFSKINGYLK